MIYKIKTRHDELCLVIDVKTDSPCKIRVIVQDANQPNTKFTDRYNTVNGRAKFFVFMPVSGANALIYVFNEDYGNVEMIILFL